MFTVLPPETCDVQSAVKPWNKSERVKQQRWGRGRGDGRRATARREDEKNDTAKWQQDENGLMGGDSSEMKMRKMSKHNTMTDSWEKEGVGWGKRAGTEILVWEINKYWWVMMTRTVDESSWKSVPVKIILQWCGGANDGRMEGLRKKWNQGRKQDWVGEERSRKRDRKLCNKKVKNDG